MPDPEQMPDIDPTVNQYLEEAVEALTNNSVPSKTFGDEVVIDPVAKNRRLPGETVQEAHKRIQSEQKGDLPQ